MSPDEWAYLGCLAELNCGSATGRRVASGLLFCFFLSTPVADGQLSTEVSWTLVWGNWGVSAEPRHPEDSSTLAGGPHPPWRRDLAVTLTGAPSGSVLAWESRALEKNGDTEDTPPHPRLCCPWFHLPMANHSQRILNRKFQK